MEATRRDEAVEPSTGWRDATTRLALDAIDVQLGKVVGADAPAALGADDEANDGRTLRRTRNREAVIVALLDLIRDGELDPNVAQIADRAEVSHRSVFRYFDDLSDLVRTAIEHEIRRALPLSIVPDLGMGSLPRRVDSIVDARLRVHEATHQVSRVARLRAPEISAIDESLKVVASLNRAQLRTHFDRELSAIGDARSEFVLDAATVLTSFESYDLHHRMLEHTTERIRLVWHHALLAIFGG